MIQDDVVRTEAENRRYISYPKVTAALVGQALARAHAQLVAFLSRRGLDVVPAVDVAAAEARVASGQSDLLADDAGCCVRWNGQDCHTWSAVAPSALALDGELARRLAESVHADLVVEVHVYDCGDADRPSVFVRAFDAEGRRVWRDSADLGPTVIGPFYVPPPLSEDVSDT